MQQQRALGKEYPQLFAGAMGRGAGEMADFYCDPANLGYAIDHGVQPPWMDEEEWDDVQGGATGSGPFGGDGEDGPAGQGEPTWTAVVQGKFRVQQRGGADLFQSDGFRQRVRRHQEAERANPRRSIAEQWSTLVYPSMGDKCTIWWTDEQGVERRTGDLIECQPPRHWKDLLLDDYGGQMAEDIFWTAAILWKHFGTSGDSEYDQAFARKLDEVERANQTKPAGGAAGQPTAAAAAVSSGATRGSKQTLKFFHGTSWEIAQRIQRDGFIESSDPDGCLGPGVYVAQREKALRFAQDTARHGGRLGGLVEVLVSFHKAKYVRSNDTTWRQEGFDACRADETTRSTNMEWCIANRSQVQVMQISPVEVPGGAIAAAEPCSAAVVVDPKRPGDAPQSQPRKLARTEQSGTAAAAASSPVKQGTVHSYMDGRGFGFIRPRDGEENVFFHKSAIAVADDRGLEVLAKGDEVRYQTEWDANRSKHKAIRVVRS